MKVAHLLRKYNPAEWGGTETAVKRLLDGLANQSVGAVIFAPKARLETGTDPFAKAGYPVKRYRAVAPVWRISSEQRDQLIAVGGNLISFDLLPRLLFEPGLDVIHTHALNRLGAIGLSAARLRRIPLVVTVHGGYLDLPAETRRALQRPLEGGIEWGKLFGALLRSRQLLARADAIVTCNQKEAELLRELHPAKRIMVQPHGVPARVFQNSCEHAATAAFPEISGKPFLLMPGRIDPVKNQTWVVQQMPKWLESFPELRLVLAGPCTDEPYGKALKKEIRNLGLEQKVVLTGGIPFEDPRLIGLLQMATAVVSASFSETFGLVILEAWAAGAPVIASKTSGACALIEQRRNGWLFDLTEPEEFQTAVSEAMRRPDVRAELAELGRRRVLDEFDTDRLAVRMKDLYLELSGATTGVAKP